MPKSLTFASVVEAADRLSLDEQLALAELLRKRSLASRRKRLIARVKKAHRQHVQSQSRERTAAELIREMRA
jgi:hypothetical protein